MNRKMRKLATGLFVVSALSFGTLTTTLPFSGEPVEAASIKVLFKGKVTATVLNVRASGTTKAKIIGKLKKSATVEVVVSSKDWYKIKYGKGFGYVSSKYVKKISTPPSKPSVKVLFKGTVTASTLNVRLAASTKGKKVGTLRKGATIEVVGSINGWYKIKYKGKYGYVSGKYVKKISGTPTKPTPKPTTDVIPGAPKASDGYYLPTGSFVLPVDVVRANKVKITDSWNESVKKNEMKAIAEAIGLEFSSGGPESFIDFVRVNENHESKQFDYVTISFKIFTSSAGNKTLRFSFGNHREIRKAEGEYLLKLMLRPYLPSSYKYVAESFVRDGYMMAGNNMETPRVYDGMKVQMIGGDLKIWK